MASKDQYKRGSLGFSVADEKKAERYSKMERRVSSDALRRKQEGEKGIVMSKSEVEGRAKNARANYLENTKTEKGRNINQKNEKFMASVDLPKANSLAQYNAEKKAGDPNALQLSFEEWKKL